MTRMLASDSSSFDGAGAEEEFRGDLGVGTSVPGQPDDVLLLRGELAVGVDLALADLLAGGKQFPVSWHPVPERIASVIAGTGGAEVWLQLGEPPPNAGFPGERPPWTSVLDQCPHWLDKSGESRL
jgi:hypothetical protein